MSSTIAPSKYRSLDELRTVLNNTYSTGVHFADTDIGGLETKAGYDLFRWYHEGQKGVATPLIGRVITMDLERKVFESRENQYISIEVHYDIKNTIQLEQALELRSVLHRNAIPYEEVPTYLQLQSLLAEKSSEISNIQRIHATRP